LCFHGGLVVHFADIMLSTAIGGQSDAHTYVPEDHKHHLFISRCPMLTFQINVEIPI
jgi:hypothetical protein